MQWEAIGVIVGLMMFWFTIVAMGLSILAKLSACIAQLAALKVEWARSREADQAAHEVFAEQLEDHEERIVTLEGTEEDWTGDPDGDEENGPDRAA